MDNEVLWLILDHEVIKSAGLTLTELTLQTTTSFRLMKG